MLDVCHPCLPQKVALFKEHQENNKHEKRPQFVCSGVSTKPPITRVSNGHLKSTWLLSGKAETTFCN